MASLMPLQKSITPWKVWSREGLGGWALCRSLRKSSGARPSQLQRETLSVLQFGNFLQLLLRGAGCVYICVSHRDILIFPSGVPHCKGLELDMFSFP